MSEQQLKDYNRNMKRQKIPLSVNAVKYLDMCGDFTIRHDILIAIKGKSNYLAPLRLSVYTEGFGGLFNGSFSKGSGRSNYNAFIHRFFPSTYKSVDSQLCRDNLGGLYGAIRSALVHEFLIRDSTMVVMHSPKQLDCAIVYDPKAGPKIKFVVVEYFDHFKAAFQKYYNRVKEEPKLARKLEDALKTIDSPLAQSYRLIP
jgi:hypothetical protein